MIKLNLNKPSLEQDFVRTARKSSALAISPFLIALGMILYAITFGKNRLLLNFGLYYLSNIFKKRNAESFSHTINGSILFFTYLNFYFFLLGREKTYFFYTLGLWLISLLVFSLFDFSHIKFSDAKEKLMTIKNKQNPFNGSSNFNSEKAKEHQSSKEDKNNESSKNNENSKDDEDNDNPEGDEI